MCLTGITAQNKKVISRLYLIAVKTKRLETKVLMETDLKGFYCDMLSNFITKYNLHMKH